MNGKGANISPVLSVLSIRPFRSLWAAQIASQLAFATLLFVLALRVYQLTGSNAAVSGLFLTFGVPAVVFGMAAGAIVDHMDKRSVLIFADLARACIVVGFLFFSSVLPMVYLLSLVTAIVTQFYVPAEAPSIPRLVPKDSLVSANSLFSFTYYSSLAVGSMFAGPVLRAFGPYAVFLVISFLFVLAAWFASRLPREASKTAHLREPRAGMFIHLTHHVIDSVREGVAYVKTSHVLSDALLLLTGTQVVLALLGTLGPGFADRVLEIDVRDASILITGPAVLGIMVGALWVGNVGYRFRPQWLIERGITAAGVLLILISLTVRLKRVPLFSWFYADAVILPIEFLLFFLLGAANSMLDVPANSMLQRASEGSMRGRVYGMLTAAVGGVGILPVVISGVVADVIGVGKVIFLLGIIITVYGMWRMRYNRR
ncbi:MFS transporter [Candidatus Gottesmanbacteria bacterium]|nr:MFS transporter [Candidatus Gottesmanbacteria bacterium]